MPGSYFVEVFSEFGCGGASDTVVVVALDIPNPQVMASGPLTWCADSDSTVTLSISGNYAEVLWSNGATDSSLVVDESAIFYYIATDSLGCMNYSDSVAVIEWLDPTITIEDQTFSMGDECIGSIDLSLLIETLEYTVVWDELPNEDEIDVDGLCTGEYNVTVTDANGCSASATVVIDSGIGIEEFDALGLTIYPNPAGEVVRIDGDFVAQEIRVVDERGQVVMIVEGDQRTLNIERLAPGLYFMFMNVDGKMYKSRFVKK